MTWVKICGITNLEDALVAVDAGADAVGFVFYEKSPRYVTVEIAREIVSKLPEAVEKIGVFVDPSSDPGGTLLRAGLTGTQSYVSLAGMAGSHNSTKATGMDSFPRTPRFMTALPLSLFRNPGCEIPEMIEGFARSRENLPPEFTPPEGIFETFLLDSGNAQTPGGTGRAFQWESAQPIADSFRRNGVKLVVAGGLKPENVGEAIKMLHPWGVDVSSGVETSPGKKDPDKVRAFVRAVRECDRKVS